MRLEQIDHVALRCASPEATRDWYLSTLGFEHVFQDQWSGMPTVKGASVAAEVIGPEKGEKLVIQKMRRGKNFRKTTGERHIFTRVCVGKISVKSRRD